MTADLAHALLAELQSLPDEALLPLAERLVQLGGVRAGATPEKSSPYATAEEAAHLLRCRTRRIYELVQDGRLSRCGDGRRLLVHREEVLNLAERR